jgi:hypothetical protein
LLSARRFYYIRYSKNKMPSANEGADINLPHISEEQYESARRSGRCLACSPPIPNSLIFLQSSYNPPTMYLPFYTLGGAFLHSLQASNKMNPQALFRMIDPIALKNQAGKRGRPH